MRTVSFYILCDPKNTNEARYVGQTLRDPHKRLAEHCASKGDDEKSAWIQSLNGASPVMYVLQETVVDGSPASVQDTYRREIQWMLFFWEKGHRLTNGETNKHIGEKQFPIDVYDCLDFETRYKKRREVAFEVSLRKRLLRLDYSRHGPLIAALQLRKRYSSAHDRLVELALQGAIYEQSLERR